MAIIQLRWVAIVQRWVWPLYSDGCGHHTGMWLIATFFCFEREYRNTTNNKNEWEVGVGIRSNMNNKGFVYTDLVIPLHFM